MFYAFDLNMLPKIEKFYTVIRNTVWGITDSNHILITVTDGMCRIFCDGEEYTVNAGEAFYVPKGHYYERRPVNDSLCEMYYIHFSLYEEIMQYERFSLTDELIKIRSKIDIELQDGNINPSFPARIYIQSKTTFSDFEEIKKFLQGINLFSPTRQLMCALRSSINLSSILAIISQLTIDTVLTDTSIHADITIPPNLKRAIGYIARHCSEQITLNDLSKHCGVSKQQLIRYFKSSFNTTPIEYINNYKLARAKELLFNSPNLLISEIASELGFGSQYYFTKLFTKKLGETPSAYRYRVINYDKLKAAKSQQH